jgi:hypothetical protein
MTAALPSYPVRFVHLTAIWAFGVTQPVLALVDGNPDLLLARGATRLDLVLFAILVTVAVPVLVLAYCWFVGRLSRWAGDVLYLVALGACLAPLAARAVKLVDPALVIALCLVAVFAAAGVVLYARSRAARLFVGYSIILPVVAAAAFVHGLPTLTEDAEAAPSEVEVSSPVPVVVILLDELPAVSLMTRSGDLDAARYPAFARLARDGTWYRNATTVHEWTSDALPALVTGRIGGRSSLPTSRNYPENLFSLLGGSYTMVVHESKTQLCSERYCPREGQPVAEIVHGLAIDAARLLIPRILPGAFSSRLIHVNSDIDLEEHTALSIDRCDSALEAATANANDDILFYCHLLLPHAPWSFLPSGTQYDSTGLDGWLPTEYWGDEQWPVLQGYQRHLLQLAYTDRLLGEMLRRLDEGGLYNRALVVVAADHGVSFRAGEGRRTVTGSNLVDVANIPLFVKYPRQHEGRADERAARTIDIVPTIADVLDVQIPWEVDGESLRGPPPARREVVVDQRGSAVARASLAEMVRDRASLLQRQHAHFGEGRDSLYRIGTNRLLLGRDVEAVPHETSSVSAEIENADQIRNVRLSSGFVPARIFGRVRSGSVGPSTELAVAINGRIRALTRTFSDDGDQLFRALVPEGSFRDGENLVEVFVVRGAGNRASLAAIASTGR